eukprot:706568-Amphidinium_carterae.1
MVTGTGRGASQAGNVRATASIGGHSHSIPAAGAKKRSSSSDGVTVLRPVTEPVLKPYLLGMFPFLLPVLVA